MAGFQATESSPIGLAGCFSYGITSPADSC